MDPADLIENYLTKGILLDTNLLVLLVVGLYRPDRISTFNRTTQYTTEDFRLIARLTDRFARRVTMPQILAEADNLTRQLPSGEHHALATTVAPLIVELFEIYVPAVDVVRHSRYRQLGLTDCATIAAAEHTLVVTDDFRLSQILTHLGRATININHIRPLSWT